MEMMEVFDPDAFTADSKTTWSEAAQRYDKLSSELFGPLAKELIAFAGLRKGWHILDVACGPGIAARAAAQRLGETGKVTATDLAPGMITLAASRPPDKHTAPIEWHEMDAQNLDLPDACFDAVICQLGLMLFARPDEALAEMRRVTKPGAPVACLVQGRRSAMMFTALVLDAIISRTPHLRAPKGAPMLFAFGPDGVLEEAFTRAGLTEIVTKRLNGTFRFVSAEQYWTTMTEGAGKVGTMLRSLNAELQAKVKASVLRRAAKFQTGRFVEIPYEFVLACGFSPRKP